MPFEDNHNHQDGNSSDDDRSASKFSVSKRNRGWQGEQLELQHARITTADADKDSVVAVDLNQFRNTVVGQGYQAKHVIRQRGIFLTASSGPAASKPNDEPLPVDHASKKRKSSHVDGQNSNIARKDTPKSRTEMYFGCAGLRKFRKELAKIEKSG